MDVDGIVRDCGFDEASAGAFKTAVESGNCSRQVQILEVQRKRMLDEMRAAGKKVDCIDYVIHQCRERSKEKSK